METIMSDVISIIYLILFFAFLAFAFGGMLFLRLKGNYYKGKLGEDRIERILREEQSNGMRGAILRNLYVPKDNSETTEIDLLYITRKGIVVIESKAFRGRIIGSSEQRMWTQAIRGNRRTQRFRFPNPILQNEGHIKWLQQYILHLAPNCPMFSVVVFSNMATLKRVNLKNTDAFVINRSSLKQVLKTIKTHAKDVFTDEQVDLIANVLRPLGEVSDEVKKRHNENIRRRFRKR